MCMVLRAGSWIQVFSNLSTYHNLSKKKKITTRLSFSTFLKVYTETIKKCKNPKSTIAGYIILLFYQNQKRV